jgi:PTS system mannose-specific IIA component
VKIILASHGDLAKAFLDAAKMIVGPQEDVFAFGLYPEASLEKFEKDITEKIKEFTEQGEDVIVFTDVFFGTPFNAVVHIMNCLKFYHFTGISLPILLEVLSLKDIEDAETLNAHILEKSSSVFINVNHFLEEQN